MQYGRRIEFAAPESKSPARFLAKLHLIVARGGYKIIAVALWTKSISTRLRGTPRLPLRAVGQRPMLARRSREGLAASPIILHAVGTETFFLIKMSPQFPV